MYRNFTMCRRMRRNVAGVNGGSRPGDRHAWAQSSPTGASKTGAGQTVRAEVSQISRSVE
jgi:hypothetical protein